MQMLIEICSQDCNITGSDSLRAFARQQQNLSVFKSDVRIFKGGRHLQCLSLALKKTNNKKIKTQNTLQI